MRCLPKCCSETRAWLLCLAVLLVFSATAKPARAQDRIYGAAIPYSESYPRGEKIDAEYQEYLSQAGPYAFGVPWRTYGFGYGGLAPWGFPFGVRPGPWGPRYLPGGLNSYLGPRYAPYAWQPSPYYTWPYEWSYGLVPETEIAPLDGEPFGWAEELPPVAPGPRRLYW